MGVPYKKKRRKPGEKYVGEPGYKGPGRRGKREDYSDILKEIHGLTEAELAEWAADTDRNQFELIVYAWLSKSRSGDMRAIENVLDRLIGKVPQPTINENRTVPAPDLSKLSDEELEQFEHLCAKANQ